MASYLTGLLTGIGTIALSFRPEAAGRMHRRHSGRSEVTPYRRKKPSGRGVRRRDLPSAEGVGVARAVDRHGRLSADRGTIEISPRSRLQAARADDPDGRRADARRLQRPTRPRQRPSQAEPWGRKEASTRTAERAHRSADDHRALGRSGLRRSCRGWSPISRPLAVLVTGHRDTGRETTGWWLGDGWDA